MSSANSTLRCRPGDLALVLRSTDAGKLVTCIQLATKAERDQYHIADHNGPVWRIDRECMWADWRRAGIEIPLPFSPDAALMPIRPDDSEALDHALKEALAAISPGE
jgi:hypothetical protein